MPEKPTSKSAARLMTPAECAEMERLTNELHERLAAALKDRPRRYRPRK